MSNCVVNAGSELPQELNFTVYQGGTFNEVIIWTDADGTPIDLTDYTGIMKAKAGSETLITLTTGDGITIDGVQGKITLNISATDTASLPVANANYDLLLTSAGGFCYPLLAGLFNVREGVSVN